MLRLAQGLAIQPSWPVNSTVQRPRLLLLADTYAAHGATGEHPWHHLLTYLLFTGGGADFGGRLPRPFPDFPPVLLGPFGTGSRLVVV